MLLVQLAVNQLGACSEQELRLTEGVLVNRANGGLNGRACLWSAEVIGKVGIPGWKGVPWR